MNALALLVDEHEVGGGLQVQKHRLIVLQELAILLRHQFDPLNQNMHKTPLEKQIVPEFFIWLPQHVEHVAHVQSLLASYLIVFLDLAQHANYTQEGVFLQLVETANQFTREIRLQ